MNFEVACVYSFDEDPVPERDGPASAHPFRARRSDGYDAHLTWHHTSQGRRYPARGYAGRSVTFGLAVLAAEVGLYEKESKFATTCSCLPFSGLNLWGFNEATKSAQACF